MDRKTRDIFLNNGVKAGVPQKYILMRKLVKILRQEGEVGFEEDMQRLYTGEIRCRICDPLTVYIDPPLKWTKRFVGLWKESHVILITLKSATEKMSLLMRM